MPSAMVSGPQALYQSWKPHEFCLVSAVGATYRMIAPDNSIWPAETDRRGALMDNAAHLAQGGSDEDFLRRSFDVARRAMTHGNHPFGAILVGPDRNVLLEAENGYMPDGDGTAHAERLLATEACRRLSPELRAAATLYSSAEPCAMCAGAIYWAGIGRLVYGMSEERLRAFTGDHPENPTLNLACRLVFESGQRQIDVVGPLLEDESAEPHAEFWAKR